MSAWNLPLTVAEGGNSMRKSLVPLSLIAALGLTVATLSFAMRGSARAATNSTAQAGQKVYDANCSSCHGTDGAGRPSAFPPLAGNAMVTGSPEKVIAVVKDGLTGPTTVNGKAYSGAMPAWKGNLSDAQIAAVITYIRSSWGNKAGAVTEAQVRGVK